ncbi:17059_t:CDS:2, partial [Entrophospora sp. SA101]
KFDLSSSSEKASIIMESLKRCPSDALDMLQKFLNEDREGDEGDELVGEEVTEDKGRSEGGRNGGGGEKVV